MPAIWIKPLIGGVVATLVIVGILYYGHRQFLAGSAATRAEFIEQFSKSEGMKNDEAKKAIAAASAAARSVCEQYKLSSEACDEF